MPVRFVRVDLAFRPAPVVVFRAMHDAQFDAVEYVVRCGWLSACAGSGVEAASDAPGAAVVSPSESVVFAMMVPSVAILDFTDGDDARVGSASSFHRYRIPPAASTIRLILFVPISCIVGHVGPLLRSFCALNNDARHPLERGAGHRNHPQLACADREHRVKSVV